MYLKIHNLKADSATSIDFKWKHNGANLLCVYLSIYLSLYTAIHPHGHSRQCNKLKVCRYANVRIKFDSGQIEEMICTYAKFAPMCTVFASIAQIASLRTVYTLRVKVAQRSKFVHRCTSGVCELDIIIMY